MLGNSKHSKFVRTFGRTAEFSVVFGAKANKSISCKLQLSRAAEILWNSKLTMHSYSEVNRIVREINPPKLKHGRTVLTWNQMCKLKLLQFGIMRLTSSTAYWSAKHDCCLRKKKWLVYLRSENFARIIYTDESDGFCFSCAGYIHYALANLHLEAINYIRR